MEAPRGRFNGRSAPLFTQRPLSPPSHAHSDDDAGPGCTKNAGEPNASAPAATDADAEEAAEEDEPGACACAITAAAACGLCALCEPVAAGLVGEAPISPDRSVTEPNPTAAMPPVITLATPGALRGLEAPPRGKGKAPPPSPIPPRVRALSGSSCAGEGGGAWLEAGAEGAGGGSRAKGEGRAEGEEKEEEGAAAEASADAAEGSGDICAAAAFKAAPPAAP